MRLDKLKNIIQSSHINFLFGAGLSYPYLKTLGDIETWLTQCAGIEDEQVRQLIEDNLKISYVEGVMKPCLSDSREGNKPDLNKVETAYRDFLRIWNYIMSRRGDNLLSKQVNIFTTNIDPLVEEAAENLGIEFNNGFKGLIRPVFREETFSMTVSKVSPFYQKTSEIPMFNYLKMHGSINWRGKKDSDEISYDGRLETLEEVVKCIKKYPSQYRIMDRLQEDLQKENEEKKEGGKRELKFEDLKDAVERYINSTKSEGQNIDAEREGKREDFCSLENQAQPFRKAYDKLVMINPRKAKFRETVLDLHFYELMRLYANALEKTTTCLFVAGFSFADEHIAQITRRAAASNPTLLVIIFAYDKKAKGDISERIGTDNNNIIVLSPSEFKDSQDEEDKDAVKGLEHFDLASINEYVFEQIKKRIN